MLEPCDLCVDAPAVRRRRVSFEGRAAWLLLCAPCTEIVSAAMVELAVDARRVPSPRVLPAVRDRRRRPPVTRMRRVREP